MPPAFVGTTVCEALATKDWPLCRAARAAWRSVDTSVTQLSETGANLSDIARCDGVADLCCADVQFQREVTHELAAGSRRLHGGPPGAPRPPQPPGTPPSWSNFNLSTEPKKCGADVCDTATHDLSLGLRELP